MEELKCSEEQWPSHWHSRKTIVLGTIDVTVLRIKLNKMCNELGKVPDTK